MTHDRRERDTLDPPVVDTDASGAARDTVAADGGTTDLVGTEQSLRYARSLGALSRLARQTATDDGRLDRGDVADAVESFLRTPEPGIGYRSGLRIAAQLLTRVNVARGQIGDVTIHCEPEAELIHWTLTAGSEAATQLSQQAFSFCLGRAAWRQIIRSRVETDGASVPLTDRQLSTMADRATDRDSVELFVRVLRDRDLEGDARSLLKQYFETSSGREESLTVLRAARSLGHTEEYRRRLRATVARWHPDDGVDRLSQLVTLARDEQFYDELLGAVERYLASAEWETLPPDKRPLLTAAVEALIRRDGTGDSEALTLYRRHLYHTESLDGIGPELFSVAEKQDDDTVASNVLDTYELSSETYEESPADAELAARAAEHDGRSDEAFEIWHTLLDTAPTVRRFDAALQNRLSVLALSDAEELVDQFESFTDDPARLVAYRVQVAQHRDRHRRVVGLVEDLDELSSLPERLQTTITEAYVRSLSEMGRWSEMLTALDDTTVVDRDLERFYRRVATAMQFVNDAPGAADSEEAVDTVERLLTAPLDASQLRFVLNLGIVGGIVDGVRSAGTNDEERLDVIEGLLEILVALHAERMIDALDAAGVPTDQYREKLADVDPRRGGRQLLSTLDRELGHEGITTTNDNR